MVIPANFPLTHPKQIHTLILECYLLPPPVCQYRIGLLRRHWLFGATESGIWPFRFHRHSLQVQTHTHTHTHRHTHRPTPSAACLVPAVRSRVGNVQSHLAFGGREIFLGLGTATVCTLRGCRRFPSIPCGVWCSGTVHLVPILPDPFWKSPHSLGKALNRA